MSKILIIENCNFKDYPTGGTLSFAKQLIQSLPSNKIALVGITTDNIKIGHWTTLNIGNQTYDFFPILKVHKTVKKPLIPLRFKSLIALYYHLRRIRRSYNQIFFTQTPQFVFALVLFKWLSKSFCFAGLGNSIKLSRYKRLRFLGGIYETILLILLNKYFNCIFAAADNKAIEDFKLIHKSILKKDVISLPTRFDNNIFYPRDKITTRTKLGLPVNKTILINTGRLSWVKGCFFLIEAVLQRLIENNTLLIFVGDGEDREKLEQKYSNLIGHSILITGFLETNLVADYINSGDIYVFGSFIEGWSTSLIEALACGKPIITTDVSSARAIVQENITGFVIENRNPIQFNRAIDKALELKDVETISIEISKRYRKSTLIGDFINNIPNVKSILK